MLLLVLYSIFGSFHRGCFWIKPMCILRYQSRFPFVHFPVFPPSCSSQKTCCTHPLRRRRGGTRRSVLFRAPTLILWMLNVQVWCTPISSLIVMSEHSSSRVWSLQGINGWHCFCGLQDATRSRRCSAMLKQSCCVWAVQQSCVSPLEAKHVSQRVSISHQQFWL